MKKYIYGLACFIVSLFLFIPLNAHAYTDLNGYPWFDTVGAANYYTKAWAFIGKSPNSGSIEQNSMRYNTTSYYSGIGVITIGSWDRSFLLPYNPDVYDYYIVGTIGATNNYGYTSLNFDYIQLVSGNDAYILKIEQDSLNIIDFDSNVLTGKSFYAKLPDILGNANLNSLRFFNYDNEMAVGGDFHASICFVPIEKSSGSDSLNASILAKLTEINNNLISSNALQQNTLDSINNFDSNVGNWFSNLITQMVSGFNSILDKMTNDQNELINGYQGNDTSSANNNFSDAAADVNQVESNLTTITDSSINSYTDTAFNSNIVSDLGGSFLYVVTWFNNFWDIGGLFTQLLYTALALFVAFFILKGGFN